MIEITKRPLNGNSVADVNCSRRESKTILVETYTPKVEQRPYLKYSFLSLEVNYGK